MSIIWVEKLKRGTRHNNEDLTISKNINKGVLRYCLTFRNGYGRVIDDKKIGSITVGFVGARMYFASHKGGFTLCDSGKYALKMYVSQKAIDEVAPGLLLPIGDFPIMYDKSTKMYYVDLEGDKS